MNGEERRAKLKERLGAAPVSATALAKELGVSRQVIVQDIALLRAEGERILSTNRGYVAEGQGRVSRVFKVCHTDEQIRDELYLSADAGGCVEDVFVWHKAYGRIAAPMGVRSRAQAEEFLHELAAGVSRPLKNVTDGYHYHTVTADSEETLAAIERGLREAGFFVEPD